MEKKNDGGNAYPVFLPSGEIWEGMSLRDYFAGQALSGLSSNPSLNRDDNKKIKLADLPDLAYQLADVMLKERNK